MKIVLSLQNILVPLFVIKQNKNASCNCYDTLYANYYIYNI